MYKRQVRSRASLGLLQPGWASANPLAALGRQDHRSALSSADQSATRWSNTAIRPPLLWSVPTTQLNEAWLAETGCRSAGLAPATGLARAMTPAASRPSLTRNLCFMVTPDIA